MAGDWIKFETSTLTKPEVLKLARITGLDRHAVVGRLLVFWTWCDTNAVDGVVDACVDATVDALVDAQGFAQALQQVGWLQIDNGTERLTVPRFDRHNGKSAKNRVLKTERQAKWRASSSAKTVDACVDAPPSTREEKRRDIKEIPTDVGTKKATFRKPTPPEVAAYCTERGNGIDAQAFCDYYESVDWHVGKKRMKDWKAAVRTWEKRNADNSRANASRSNGGSKSKTEQFFDSVKAYAAIDVDSGTVCQTASALRPQVVELLPGRLGKDRNG
jgi:hypothetical protein